MTCWKLTSSSKLFVRLPKKRNPNGEAEPRTDCSGCHTQYPSALPIPGFTVNTTHNARSANVNQQSVSALLNRTGVNSNFDNPDWSPILKLGLGGDDHPTIFSSTNDPDYQLLLQWIQTGNSSD